MLARTCLTKLAGLFAGIALLAHIPLSAGAPAPPPDRAERAGALPALPMGEIVRLPLAGGDPSVWRPVGGDVSVEAKAPESALTGPRLDVRYRRPERAAAGVAFAVRPGTFGAAETLHLTISGAPRQTLRVCLTDVEGRVYTFPALDVEESATAFVLRTEDLEFDPFQNRGRREAPPVLGDVVLLTILDINGFMSRGRPDCTWTLLDAYAVRRRAEAPAPRAGATRAVSLAGLTGHPTSSAAPAAIDADAAVDLFMQSLTRDPSRRDPALEALRAAWAADPRHPRLPLLLGMAHLRIASEEGARDPAALEHLVLAVHHLEIAGRRDPEDGRIPGWRHAAGHFLARAEGRLDDAERHLDGLRAAYRSDPCFHAIPLGIALYERPRGSDGLAEGLEAMRAPMGCAEGDPSGLNGPRWPHNVQGYLLALADFEAKAGSRARAEIAFTALEASEGYAAWPYRGLAEKRRRALDRLPRDDGNGAADRLVIGPGSPVSCTICHLGG